MADMYQTLSCYVDSILKSNYSLNLEGASRGNVATILSEWVLMRALLLIPSNVLNELVNDIVNVLDMISNESLIHGVLENPAFNDFCLRHTTRGG